MGLCTISKLENRNFKQILTKEAAILLGAEGHGAHTVSLIVNIMGVLTFVVGQIYTTDWLTRWSSASG
jgi:hypothetical protein